MKSGRDKLQFLLQCIITVISIRYQYQFNTNINLIPISIQYQFKASVIDSYCRSLHHSSVLAGTMIIDLSGDSDDEINDDELDVEVDEESIIVISYDAIDVSPTILWRDEVDHYVDLRGEVYYCGLYSCPIRNGQ